MKGIIYKYTFSDGKVYIGQTRRHPEKRKREHLDEVIGPTNSGFWEAYKRLGEPEYTELYQMEKDDVDELVSELNGAESFFIQLFKADDPNYGYNRKSFGTVGTKTNTILGKRYNEYLESLLEVRLKDYENAINKVWQTKEPLTQKEKFLLREKYREQNIWQRDIDKYDFDNLANNDEIDTEFMIDDALDFVRFMITEEARRDASQYIAENYAQIMDEERSKNAILQIDKDGRVVKEFYSFNDICQFFNVPRADNVRNVLKGRQKSAYGYLWKLKKEL